MYKSWLWSSAGSKLGVPEPTGCNLFSLYRTETNFNCLSVLVAESCKKYKLSEIRWGYRDRLEVQSWFAALLYCSSLNVSPLIAKPDSAASSTPLTEIA